MGWKFFLVIAACLQVSSVGSELVRKGYSKNDSSEHNRCNGYAEYCDCEMSNVLWIGAHNALTDAGSTLQRNQVVDGPHLLNAGVRYFDIDTCVFMKNKQRGPPTVCHGYVWWRTQLYQPTEAGLQLIKSWLDIHPREVIFLNFGDLGDFTALNDDGEATPTAQLRRELGIVVRSVFRTMTVFRDDVWDAEINANRATLRQLIDANRRVIINIDKANSDSPVYWSQDDRVCNDEWYPDNLKLDLLHPNYNWNPAIEYIDEHMRIPCSTDPKLLRKLEFAFYTALGGTIDSDHVGVALSDYLSSVQSRNVKNESLPPFFPFNLVLTDHSDKWQTLYTGWHRAQIDFLAKLTSKK